jgi:hypothetical protein
MSVSVAAVSLDIKVFLEAIVAVLVLPDDFPPRRCILIACKYTSCCPSRRGVDNQRGGRGFLCVVFEFVCVVCCCVVFSAAVSYQHKKETQNRFLFGVIEEGKRGAYGFV